MSSFARLTRADFIRLRRAHVRRVHGALFSLAISPLSTGGASKFACVVSKKVSSKAVERNRIKRRCREAVRTLMSNPPISQAFIFTAKRTARDAPSEDLARDVVALLKKM